MKNRGSGWYSTSTEDSLCSLTGSMNEEQSPHNPIRSWFKAGCSLCKAHSILVCSPPRVQLRVWVAYQSYQTVLNVFLLNTEKLLKSALLFSSFLWRLCFLSRTIKNQQMPREKSRWRGDYLLFLGILASQVLVALAALNYNFFFFCYLQPHEEGSAGFSASW